MTEKYSKEELEKLIWESPIERVASKMGVTGTALHKRCKRLGVVKPPQGHWAKLEHGKPVTTLSEERDLQKSLEEETLDSKRYWSGRRGQRKGKRTMEKKQNKTSKPKSKGWKVELYLGSFKTGIQLIKQ